MTVTRRWDGWLPYVYGVGYGAIIVMAGILLGLAGRDEERIERAKCDAAVATFLSTRDEIELQRASFLIKTLNCSVSRRLPR